MSLDKAKELLEASKKGDIESAYSLIGKKRIDINCKDILAKKYS